MSPVWLAYGQEINLMTDEHLEITNLKQGEQVAQKAIWLEGSLVAAKIAGGLLSGSTALISDAVHSASDILSIVTSWIGMKIAQKEPDEKFPYGYYKAENLGTLIISAIILYAGWEMVTQGYVSLSETSQIKVPLFALGVSLFDAVVLFLFGTYEVKIGKKTGVQSLIAMGKENRSHIFSSLAVFLGTLSAYFQIPYIEGVVTIIISLLIFKIGFESLKDSVLVLMDVSPDQEVEQQIKESISDTRGVEEFYDLRLRKSGPSIFGEVKVGIRRDVDVKQAHDLASRVETAIKNQVGKVDSFMVHVEPFKTDYRHLVIPVKEKNNLNSEISNQFARSPYFLFVNLKGEKIKGFYILDNPYRDQKKRAGLSVAKLAAEKKSDTIITPEIGEIAYHALKEYLFDVYQAIKKVAQELIDNFKNNQLQEISPKTVS
jgi:cation diffusion facilitator family transporter